MVDYYNAQAISGFNTNPPSDDGSQTEANRGKWSTVLDKIGTPLKNRQDAIDAELTNMSGRMFLNGSVSKSVNYTVQATDLAKRILCTGSVTITLLDVATAENGFVVTVVNSGSGAIVVAPASGETLNGVADDTVSLDAGEWAIAACDGSGWDVAVTKAQGNLLPLGYSSGLAISIGTDTDHDINVTAGVARDSANATDITLSAITKQIDATWAAGTDAGGLSSSLTAPANTTTYYVHAIIVGGVADVGIDTSATAANLIADHSATAYRHIGYILTNGSANIAGVFPAASPGTWSLATLNTTTGGTAINFTGVIAPWAQDVELFASISLSGTDETVIQIGDSGGLETTAYTGNIVTGAGGDLVNWSAGSQVTAAQAAASTYHIETTLKLINPATNLWAFKSNATSANGAAAHMSTGFRVLDSALDRITLKSTGTDTIDVNNYVQIRFR